MKFDSAVFDAAVSRISRLRNTLLLFALVALAYASADLYLSARKMAKLDVEISEIRALDANANDLASRLRFALHNLYPDRAQTERQKLALFIYDIRRARRALARMDDRLLAYREPDLPLLGEGLSRASIQSVLQPLRSRIFFLQAMPGAESPLEGELIMLNVSINELSGDQGVAQLPLEQLAVLVAAADALPPQFADTLEAFAPRQGPAALSVVSLQALFAGLNAIAAAPLADGRNTAVAKKFLEELIRERDKCSGGGDLDECRRQQKYLSPSHDDVRKWRAELLGEYVNYEKRRRGENDVSIPGIPASLPVWIAMGAFALVALYVNAQLPRLVALARASEPRSASHLEEYTLKYGAATMSMAGFRGQDKLHPAMESVFVIAVAIAFVGLLGFSRGTPILLYAVPAALIVVLLETLGPLRYAYGTRSGRTWPAGSAERLKVPRQRR